MGKLSLASLIQRHKRGAQTAEVCPFSRDWWHHEAPGDIIEFATLVLGGPPDPWQREYLEAVFTERDIAIVASRQSGKSTITAVAVAYLLLWETDFRVVVLSKTLAQASLFMGKVTRYVLKFAIRKRMEAVNRLSLILPNDSIAVCVPCANPDAARGYSPHLLIADEAAFIPETTFVAVTPMLAATAGAMHMISSPNGPQGYFYEAVEGKLAAYFKPKRVTWEMCPRIDRRHIEKERTAYGDLYFQQEYGAQFIQMEGAFIPASVLARFKITENELAGSFADVPYSEIEPEIADLRAAYDKRLRVTNARFFDDDL